MKKFSYVFNNVKVWPSYNTLTFDWSHPVANRRRYFLVLVFVLRLLLGVSLGSFGSLNRHIIRGRHVPVHGM